MCKFVCFEILSRFGRIFALITLVRLAATVRYAYMGVNRKDKLSCHLRDFVHHLPLLRGVLHDNHANHLLGYLGLSRSRNIKLCRPLLFLDQLLGHLHDYDALLPSRWPFPSLLDVLHDQLVKHLLLDVLHDHLVTHPLLDVLHDHLVKHLLLPILDVLHEL